MLSLAHQLSHLSILVLCPRLPGRPSPHSVLSFILSPLVCFEGLLFFLPFFSNFVPSLLSSNLGLISICDQTKLNI